MNAKPLYDAINKLVFAVFLLLTLFSFMVLKKPFDSSTEENKKSKVNQLIDVPKKIDSKFAKGKALFKLNCASCHNRNLKDDLIGPALGGVTERWAEYPKEDLYKWIRNSQAMIAEGHPRAKFLIEKYKSTMNSYPNLTDEEIEAMLYFFDEGVR